MTAQIQECKPHSPESPPPFQRDGRQLLRRRAKKNLAVNEPQEFGTSVVKTTAGCSPEKQNKKKKKEIYWSAGGGCWSLVASITESRRVNISKNGH